MPPFKCPRNRFGKYLSAEIKSSRKHPYVIVVFQATVEHSANQHVAEFLRDNRISRIEQKLEDNQNAIYSSYQKSVENIV